jgi:ankyrin repeat protein
MSETRRVQQPCIFVVVVGILIAAVYCSKTLRTPAHQPKTAELLFTGILISLELSQVFTIPASAVMEGHCEVVTLLESFGGDLTVVDSSGRSLWHEAADRGDVSILWVLERLLGATNTICAAPMPEMIDGAVAVTNSPSSAIAARLRSTGDVVGRSPLHCAALQGHCAMARALIEASRPP